jgi:hypothetical protein
MRQDLGAVVVGLLLGGIIGVLVAKTLWVECVVG